MSAISFQKFEALSAKDAIHLACAAHTDAQYFLTCDDRLIRYAHRLNLKIIAMNPVDYIRQEAR